LKAHCKFPDLYSIKNKYIVSIIQNKTKIHPGLQSVEQVSFIFAKKIVTPSGVEGPGIILRLRSG